MQELIDRCVGMLGQVREKGDEIQPIYCPICKGGKNKDKQTFGLNKITGVFNCLRGSCNSKGNIYQLAEILGLENSKKTKFINTKPVKIYKKPENKSTQLSKKILDYWKLRGISEETLAINRVTENKGNIQFNYYDENGELTFIKYKVPKKNPKMKSWREKNTKPILYGMDRINYSKPLIIVEGEPDKLVLDECGIENATSIPSGVKEWEWVSNCWEWLENFNEIILWGDNDAGGKEFIQTAISKFEEWKIRIVKCNHKDANVMLYKEGKEEVKKAIRRAEIVDKDYIIDLADVQRKDYRKKDAISTGFDKIDSLIGGFYPGQLVIWTGYTGGGKSTFISNMLADNIRENRAFIYSGELSKEEFKEALDMQVLGKKNLSSYDCPVKKESIPIPNSKFYDKLDKYYREKLYLFDSSDYATDKDVLKAMKYMARREDCKIFVLDNLMVIPSTDSGDIMEKTGKFIGRLKQFARTQNVIVHLVAHPKKPAKDQKRINVYDVSGTANIVNLADRLIIIHKIRECDVEDTPELEEYQSIFTIEKDRKFGVYGKDIPYKFEFNSKRFWSNTHEKSREFLKAKEDKVLYECEEVEEDMPWDKEEVKKDAGFEGLF